MDEELKKRLDKLKAEAIYASQMAKIAELQSLPSVYCTPVKSFDVVIKEIQEALKNKLDIEDFDLLKEQVDKIPELYVTKEDIKEIIDIDFSTYAKKTDLKKKLDITEFNKTIQEKLDNEKANEKGTFSISYNENSSDINYTSKDKLHVANISVTDGSEDGNYINIKVGDIEGPKIRLDDTKAYYTKEAKNIDDNSEIIVKKDILNLAKVKDLQKYIPITIKDGNNISYMANEKNGGIMKFTKEDGTYGKFTLYDGSDENNTMLQIVVSNEDKSKVAKINGTLDGLFYSKETNITPENEIATVKEINNLKKEIEQLKQQVQELTTKLNTP